MSESLREVWIKAKAAIDGSCGCTMKQRESGHLIECWYPTWEIARNEIDSILSAPAPSREESGLWKAAEDALAILEVGKDFGLHDMATPNGRAAWIDRMIPVRERLRSTLAASPVPMGPDLREAIRTIFRDLCGSGYDFDDEIDRIIALVEPSGLREAALFLVDAVERLNKTHPSDTEGRLRRWKEVFHESDRVRAALAASPAVYKENSNA